MRLQRLAGFGPLAAFVSAVSLLVIFVLEEFGSAIQATSPSIAVAVSIIFFLLIGLWVAALNVVTFDLEWMEHPNTSTRWFQVARVLTLIAVFMPVVILLDVLFNGPIQLQAISNFLIWGAIGVSLFIHTFDARRAGILHGVLPWLGMVDGVLFLIAAIGYALFIVPAIGMSALVAAINFLLLGEVVYIVWSIWLGVKLSRSKTALPARLAPATH